MGVSALQSGVKGLDSTSGPAAYSQLTGFKGQSVSGRPGLSPIESLFWGVKLSQTEILKKDIGGNRRQPQILQRGHEGPRTPCCASRPNMLPTNISCNSLGLGLCSLRFDIEET